MLFRSARLLCPWDSPGKNTAVGCHFLLQRIFPTQGSNPRLLSLLHCRWTVYITSSGPPVPTHADTANSSLHERSQRPDPTSSVVSDTQPHPRHSPYSLHLCSHTSWFAFTSRFSWFEWSEYEFQLLLGMSYTTLGKYLKTQCFYVFMCKVMATRGSALSRNVLKF